MLLQNLTFREIASELSKTGLQFMKEDTTQRNGGSEASLGGKRMLGLAACHQVVGHWDSHIWEGPVVKRDWEIISNLRG